MNASQFSHVFWDYYITVLVVVSLLGLLALLWSQRRPPTHQPSHATEQWDGIQKNDHPMPKWWFYLFVGLIVWAGAYLLAYPGLGSFQGLLAWSSDKQYQQQLNRAQIQFDARFAHYTAMPIEQVAQSPAALAVGQNLYQNYCIQCHGIDGKGMRGFPDLTDGDWLWGGTPNAIHTSIASGRFGIMPAMQGILTPEQIQDTTHYVLSLSRPEEADSTQALRGKAIFHSLEANCATCHGVQGQGVVGLGPNLSDGIWLWGGSKAQIQNTINFGKSNQMPAWDGFLDENKLHLLSAYVWSLAPPEQRVLPETTAHPNSESSP